MAGLVGAGGAPGVGAPTLADVVAHLERERLSRVFVLSPDENSDDTPPINSGVYDLAAKVLRAEGRVPRLDVIVHSIGGVPSAAFKIARLLQRSADELNIIVPTRAKSAATMIALSAQNLLLAPGAELGPIDMQVRDSDDPEEWRSALEAFKALDSVSSFCQILLAQTAKFVQDLTQRKPADCIEIAAHYAAPVAQPLFQQINPQDLGRYQRALEVMENYAARVMEATKRYTAAEIRAVTRTLVYSYPTHEFVIDIVEAQRVGIKCVDAGPKVADISSLVVALLPPHGHVGFVEPQPSASTKDATDGKDDEKQEDDTSDAASQSGGRSPVATA